MVLQIIMLQQMESRMSWKIKYYEVLPDFRFGVNTIFLCFHVVFQMSISLVFSLYHVLILW